MVAGGFLGSGRRPGEGWAPVLGAWKVMWEMQQLGRRAGALDIGLISNQPGKQTLLSSSAQGLDERKDGRCSRAAPHRLA